MYTASAVLLTQNITPERMGLNADVMNTAMELGVTAGMTDFLSCSSNLSSSCHSRVEPLILSANILSPALATAVLIDRCPKCGQAGRRSP
ncbi:hypothetical protein [Octadecabacter antarcticus]|uniref:hypothetical protein n=1 Tax=Octadecabacter antarcticus TaxID=1217908 RepID=UPI001650FDFD|nr:hypothetical protein [Octadecabacter antarcticus]